MFKTFIERPVLSTVISILIVLLGILGLVNLPISQYPDITPPTVQVSTSYAGANADVVLKSVIVPLEESINGVEGMTYMTSSATNEGSGTISIYFKVGTNPDQAAVDVQNRVSTASNLLPSEVTQSGVTVRKRQSSMLLMTGLYSDNPNYDETFLQNYAEINLVPLLLRVEGVGSAAAYGSRNYSMRIWLKPDIMSVYGLVPSDVTSALSEQNIESAPGKFGEQGKQSFQYVIKYTGKLKTAEEFGNIVIKAGTSGKMLRLKDIARVELGSLSYSTELSINGKSGTNIAVNQTAGSNARDVINGCKAVIKEASKSFPAGVHYTNMVDANRFLDVSIEKVIKTFIEAFLLVFLVVFLFLQDFRSSLIPAISVPVAIIGTFFFLYIFGFSINLLTLFALILAIGIVIDDAIVVVEAVHAKLDQGYQSARKASIDAMSEITGAIISITLVMASVFVPVSFISGSSGVFYKQFGLTLAIAIILSALNALTLSPALAALFLKPKGEEQPKQNYYQRFNAAFNVGFQATAGKYTQTISFLAKRKKLIIALVLVFAGGFYFLIKHTSTGFVPEEDMGTVFVNVSLPPASSMERTAVVAEQVDSIVRTIPGVGNVMRMVGQNMLNGSGSSYAMIIMELKNWKERKGISNTDIINKLMQKTASIRNATILPFSLPTITGFGMSNGFSFELQDKGGHTTDEFYKVSQDFLAALGKHPEIQYAATTFNPNFPQYLLSLNVPKIKEAGMTVDGVMNAMQVYYGGLYASNFNQFGKQYRVMVQADTSYRANIDGLNKIYVRGSNDNMAPLSEFATLTRVYGPESISRFNLYTSMTVNGAPGNGYSTGESLQAIKEVAATKLPQGYGFEFSGISREEENSSSQIIYVFMLSLIFVYLLLSALYESYLLPFAVLLSLPVGLSGTFVFAKIFGIDNNIYTQISMIMLIGLLAKNAILIVEFALARRRKGMPVLKAAVEGAKARFRPILMTSFAFIFGIMPLMFATGAGANGNRSIGVSAVGGMLFGTLFGILIIPGLFVIFQQLGEKLSKHKIEESDSPDEGDSLNTTPVSLEK
jgi:hydrophobic/amphiphilic exporter-1 (mainly G- bacteria), HAE1 family